MTHSPQLGDVQSPCCLCVSSRARSQLKVKYFTNNNNTLCCVRSINPLLIEGFLSNLNDTLTPTRGCAEPMCQLKVKVTVKCQINQNKIYIHLKIFIECYVSQVTPVCIISPLKSFNFFQSNP